MSLAWDNSEFIDALEDWRREDFATDERQVRLIQQQKPGLFPTWKHAFLTALLLASPWIGYAIWKWTR